MGGGGPLTERHVSHGGAAVGVSEGRICAQLCGDGAGGVGGGDERGDKDAGEGEESYPGGRVGWGRGKKGRVSQFYGALSKKK